MRIPLMKSLRLCFGLITASVACQAAYADILIKGAQLLDAQTPTMITADVLVRGQKIVQVAEQISEIDGVETIDASGKILSTGLFNSETQLGLTEVGAVANTRDYSTLNTRITASLKVSDAINPSSVLLPHNRMLGLTHALVMPASEGGLFAGTAAIIQLTEVDTIVRKDVAMVVTLGAQGKELAGGSRAAAMAVLREAFEDARDYRANKSSYNSGNRRDYLLSRHDLAALVPVLERRMPLIVHVDRSADITRVVEFAKQAKIKLIIAGATEGWRVADMLAQNKIPVIMDPIFNLPSSYDKLGSRLDNAAMLDQAGVTLLFTGMSWHNTHNAYLVRQSAGNAVSNGLAYNSAIKAITSNPASVFGLDSIGQLEKGSDANLVLWSGDPLETSTIVEKVLINGMDYPLQSRATRLRDRYYQKLKDN